MNASPAADSAGRLALLGGYLQEDPANPALLAEAFDVAVGCGLYEQAQEYVALAERHALDPPAWTFRQARLCIARRNLPQAAALLEQLQSSTGDDPVIAHDLAYVRLLQGDFSACRSLLQSWVDHDDDEQPSVPAATKQALQVLWLRASHRLRLLEESCDWIRREDMAGRLHPAAKGVASLIAIDADDFAAAHALSEAALADGAVQLEALVARACVALAMADHAQAAELLRRALECNPEDGRTWSTLGMASLLARNLPLAQQQLERAVRTLAGHVGTWHGLGWSRLLQGDRAGARAAFQQALLLDRSFAESHGALGLVLAISGEHAQAQHHLDAADKLDRRNVTGRYARALLAGEAGDAARLKELAVRLLDRPGFFGGKLSEGLASIQRERQCPGT